MASATEDQEPPVCYRCLISGRVQGVFFRASTREQAERYGVTGHACNLPDGRVEVLVCGAPDAVLQVRRWLAQGPPQAHVDDLHCEPIEWRALSGFTTG